MKEKTEYLIMELSNVTLTCPFCGNTGHIALLENEFQKLEHAFETRFFNLYNAIKCNKCSAKGPSISGGRCSYGTVGYYSEIKEAVKLWQQQLKILYKM